MSEVPASVEELLDRLAATTSGLGEALNQPERAWELIKERGWIVRELTGRGAHGRFADAELQRLGDATRTAEKVRQSWVVRRETAREQARELRAARRVQNEFQPHRETSGGHLAVDG